VIYLRRAARNAYSASLKSVFSLAACASLLAQVAYLLPTAARDHDAAGSLPGSEDESDDEDKDILQEHTRGGR
jgi:hypothetical protein